MEAVEAEEQHVVQHLRRTTVRPPCARCNIAKLAMRVGGVKRDLNAVLAQVPHPGPCPGRWSLL